MPDGQFTVVSAENWDGIFAWDMEIMRQRGCVAVIRRVGAGQVIHLRTDQYTDVSRDRPVHVDLCPVDDPVEISLGEHRIGGGDILRFVIDHPDTCQRLVEALQDAHTRLIEHLRVKPCPDHATYQVDMATLAVRVVS